MPNIEITEKAILEINIIKKDQKLDDVVLRIRCVGGGCSGMQVKLDLDENFDETKDIITEQDGIKIAVDKRSALYLEGASIDYLEDLNKRGFIVDNPAATSRCGCGSSFSM